ncbi:MAG: hypothetical protein LBC53_05280, partial [Spirochaetaceae bacterium]|nr:hypothetical protein [Spirochaetaceae bacterium]
MGGFKRVLHVFRIHGSIVAKTFDVLHPTLFHTEVTMTLVNFVSQHLKKFVSPSGMIYKQLRR